jgi:hypothetical protein
MYTGCIGPKGVEHHLMQALPELPEAAAGPGRYVRLVLHRGPGPDFSECDRALLVLLRPHLHQAYLDAERRRHPVPRLTPRQNGLLRLVAAGHTNTQIARRLGISESRPACRICLRTPASGGLSYPNRTQVGHVCIRVECRDRELRGGQPGHGRGTAGAPWRVLLIEGRAGIGKTSLVEAACLRGRNRHLPPERRQDQRDLGRRRLECGPLLHGYVHGTLDPLTRACISTTGRPR